MRDSRRPYQAMAFFLDAVERGHLELPDETFLAGRVNEINGGQAVERSLIAVAYLRRLACGAADALCASAYRFRMRCLGLSRVIATNRVSHVSVEMIHMTSAFTTPCAAPLPQVTTGHRGIKDSWRSFSKASSFSPTSASTEIIIHGAAARARTEILQPEA